MSSAYHPRPRSLNKRGLALSIAFHLLLLLAFLIQLHRPVPERPSMPVPPPVTLDLPVAGSEPASVPTAKKAAPELSPQPRRTLSPPPAPLPALLPKAAPPPAAPSPPSVQPVVPLPTVTAAQNGTESGTAPIGRAANGTGSTAAGGSHSGDGARGGGDGAGAGAERDSADRPDWIVKPTPQQETASLSLVAKGDRANGWAVISCLVTRANRVRDCKIIAESPKSTDWYRFGDSALLLSRYFRIRPPMRNGQPRYDIRVRIPIYWTWK
jgi:protein TonB